MTTTRERRQQRRGRPGVEVLEARLALASYSFTPIAVSGQAGVFAIGEPTPVINDAGAIAYVSRPTAAGEALVYVDPRGKSTVVDRTDSAAVDFEDVRLNARGVVSYLVDNNGVKSIYAWTAPAEGQRASKPVLLLRTGRTFQDLRAPALSTAGVLAFWGRQANAKVGIYTYSLKTKKVGTVAEGTSPGVGFGDPAINAAGQVAFLKTDGLLPGGASQVVVVSAGKTTTIAKTGSGPKDLRLILGVDLNDKGVVAWSGANADGGIQGVGGLGRTSVIWADGTGELGSLFGSPALNTSGRVGFAAARDSEPMGLFTGANPDSDRVIAAGEVLGGSTILGLSLGRGGMNDDGQLVFRVVLNGGLSNAIYRADPGPDLKPMTLSHTALRDAERGVLQFTYEVRGEALPQDTTVALYWAKGKTFQDRLGQPFYPVDTNGTAIRNADRGVGSHGPFYVPASQTMVNPAEATYVLLVVDPPDRANPDGRVREPNDGEKNVLAVPLSTLMKVREEKTAGLAAFTVPNGQFTFDVEGTEGGAFFSRRPHQPSSASGVTIGRGYDMSQRKASDIQGHLVASGVPTTVAAELAKAAGLTGTKARKFLGTRKLLEITPTQQKRLFPTVYQEKATLVQGISKKPDTVKAYGTLFWSRLPARVRDLLVDLAFRGDYTSGSRKAVQPTVTDKAGKKDGAGDPVAFRAALANKANFPSNLSARRHGQRLRYLDGRPYL